MDFVDEELQHLALIVDPAAKIEAISKHLTKIGFSQKRMPKDMIDLFDRGEADPRALDDLLRLVDKRLTEAKKKVEEEERQEELQRAAYLLLRKSRLAAFAEEQAEETLKKQKLTNAENEEGK
jgi:hypothetical protein